MTYIDKRKEVLAGSFGVFLIGNVFMLENLLFKPIPIRTGDLAIMFPALIAFSIFVAMRLRWNLRNTDGWERGKNPSILNMILPAFYAIMSTVIGFFGPSASLQPYFWINVFYIAAFLITAELFILFLPSINRPLTWKTVVQSSVGGIIKLVILLVIVAIPFITIFFTDALDPMVILLYAFVSWLIGHFGVQWFMKIAPTPNSIC